MCIAKEIRHTILHSCKLIHEPFELQVLIQIILKFNLWNTQVMSEKEINGLHIEHLKTSIYGIGNL